MLTRRYRVKDIEDVEGFCQRIIQQSGLDLTHHDREDLLAFLVATTWELSLDYQEGVYRKGFAFYAGAHLKRRLVDWNRKRFGRTRWQFRDRVYERPVPTFVALDDQHGTTQHGSQVDADTDSLQDLLGLDGAGDSPPLRGTDEVGEGPARRAA